MPDMGSKISFESIPNNTKSTKDKNPNQTTANESSRCLLKDSKTSILGDICITIGTDNYILDRAMLASKSNYLASLLETEYENQIDTTISKLVQNDSSRFSNIVDIIYGKDLKSILSKNNFFNLFHDMNEMRMELDMEIFKQFIDEIFTPAEKLDSRMFELYAYTSISPKFPQEMLSDYLLPSISRYFSEHLIQIYDMNEFLSLPIKAFILILFNSSQKSSEKELISRICTEWIHYDFQNRIMELNNIVNATKYRYGLSPYYKCDPKSLIKPWQSQKSNQFDNVTTQEIEKRFNQLLFFHRGGELESLSDLKDKLYKIVPEPRVVNPIDQATKWMSISEHDLFCDVAINVRGATFKLHRIKLASKSGYFYDLFTNPTNPTTSNVKGRTKKSRSTMMQHSVDEIDPMTFFKIMLYIYKQEIKVTSPTQLNDIIKASNILKIDDLCQKYNSSWISDPNTDIFEKFHYIRQTNKTDSEQYLSLVEKILKLWPKLDQNPQFKDITLDTLKEILALPQLKINHPDEILDLCSEWIFHDIENRYHFTIEVAQAINRNFIEDSSQFKLKMPSNSTDYTKQYVKEQLTKILRSTALITFTFDSDQNKNKRNPRFLFETENNFLSILDVNFDEIIQLGYIGDPDPELNYHYSSTMIDDKLFILFNVGDKFNFQVYYPSSNKIVSLATDARMQTDNWYDILNCNGEIYFWFDNDDGVGIILKYCFKLNRWISFFEDTEGKNKSYISDGKKLYKLFNSDFDKKIDGWPNKVSFLDINKMEWIPLPDLPVITQKSTCADADDQEMTYINEPVRVNIINQELYVLFSSKTCAFNWLSQTWISISNLHENFKDFTRHGNDIIYVTDEGEVYAYSPLRNEWTLQRVLENFYTICAIKAINE